jgi:hypothetical protein
MAKRLKLVKKKIRSGLSFFKFIFWSVGILTALFIVLFIGASVYISTNYPPAKLKAMAEDKLSETLKRKVVIGDVYFHVLSGFEVIDLHVGNRAGWADQDFVSAKDILISYHWLPLLSGKIALGEIRLNAAQILIERRGLNQFNVSDMVSGNPVTAMILQTQSSLSWVASADAAILPTTVVSGGKSDLLFSIDDVTISHSVFVYLDETITPLQRTDLNDVNLQVKNISLDGGLSSFSLSLPMAYNHKICQVGLAGSCRYLLTSQSVKDLSVKGKVDDQDFAFTGEVSKMFEDLSPRMDGTASLDMLQLSGLVPESLYAIPKGLVVSGPAKVNFHLSGSVRNGLEIKGTADATDLVVQYQDLFAKAPQTPCRLDFDGVKKQDSWEISSFHAIFKNYALDGAFHYKNGVSYACEVHSKYLSLAVLNDLVPHLKNGKVDGAVVLNLNWNQLLGKPASLNGSGNYAISNGTVKGYAIITFFNTFFKDKEGGITLDNLTGNFTAENTALTFTANGNGKMGQIRANGTLNMQTWLCAPEIKIQSDIHKDFLDSDAIKAQLPDNIKDKFDINLLADSNGTVPLDFRITDDPTKPTLKWLDISRLGNIFLNNYVNQASSNGQNILQGLFGH